MYTHFASGFRHDGRLDPRFTELMTRLAAKNGWFVPVTTLLDYLADRPRSGHPHAAQRRGLERRWLLSKARAGHS